MHTDISCVYFDSTVMLICYIPILLCSLIQMVCIDNRPGISGARWSPARKLPLVSSFFFGRRLLLFPFASLGWGETERCPGGFVSLISCPSTLLLPYTLEASTNAVIPLNCSPAPTTKLETIRVQSSINAGRYRASFLLSKIELVSRQWALFY